MQNAVCAKGTKIIINLTLPENGYQAETRIVIADDHAIFRHGLCRVLEREAGLHVVGEAGDGETALARIEELRPDVAPAQYRHAGQGRMQCRALSARSHALVKFALQHKSEL